MTTLGIWKYLIVSEGDDVSDIKEVTGRIYQQIISGLKNKDKIYYFLYPAHGQVTHQMKIVVNFRLLQICIKTKKKNVKMV